MIDIHSHILPGIDDGAQTMEDTVALLKLAQETGTTHIVASPHADTTYTYDVDKVTALIAEAQALAGDGIKILRGCDFHLMMANVQDAMEHPRRYTINEGPYLLMELAEMLIFPNTSQIWQRLEDLGMRIILTHPERNPILQQDIDKVQRWVEEGRYMQVTSQSLLGMFGPKPQKFATTLIERGLAHFVASDGHNLTGRPPRLDHGYQYVQKCFGEELAEILFEIHPRAVIEGDSVDTWMPRPERSQSRSFFGKLFGR